MVHTHTHARSLRTELTPAQPNSMGDNVSVTARNEANVTASIAVGIACARATSTTNRLDENRKTVTNVEIYHTGEGEPTGAKLTRSMLRESRKMKDVLARYQKSDEEVRSGFWCRG